MESLLFKSQAVRSGQFPGETPGNVSHGLTLGE